MLSMIPLPWKIGIAAALAFGLFAGYLALQAHWMNIGGAKVTAKVQETTIKTIDAARTGKEKANETVRNTPLDSVIDGLK